MSDLSVPKSTRTLIFESPRWVIDKGTRWLAADGYMLNIDDSKRWSQPSSFKVITPKNEEVSLLRVANLIDRALGEWRSAMIDNVSQPMQVY